MFRAALTVLAVVVVSIGAKAPSTAAQSPLPPPFAGAMSPLASPAAEGAAQPNLTTDARGRVWLSWLEPRPEGGHRFRLSSLAESSWTAPVTIAEGANFLANWADFPSVFAAADGTLAAHWLERGANRSAYGIRMRTSRDGGKTWSVVLTPHRDASETEHGFVSFFDAPGGGIGLVWLDGRGMASHTMAGGGNMTLRSTVLRNGAFGEDVLIDPRVCDCCQTSAARTAAGVLVAYRDRSDAEIRDISIIAFRNGRWSSPAPVGTDHWEIHGCPVNGPVVAASGNAAAVAWFTGEGGSPKVQVAFSSDGGNTFANAVRVDGTANVTLGRLGMLMTGPDRVLVSSLERTGQGARVSIRDVRRDGRVSTPAVVAEATPDRTGGFARIAQSGNRVIVAWTDARPTLPTRVALAAGAIR